MKHLVSLLGRSSLVAGALCAGALLLTLPSFAQGFLQQAPKSGLYLQLGVGQSWQDSPANTEHHHHQNHQRMQACGPDASQGETPTCSV